jgi:hypothetical protein
MNPNCEKFLKYRINKKIAAKHIRRNRRTRQN